MKISRLIFIIPVVGLALWLFGDGGGPRHESGVLIADAPEQIAVDDTTEIVEGDYLLTPRAHFNLSARVLSHKVYRYDTEAALSPVDLALGWQRMSDSAVIDQISISQSGRFYRWRVRDYPIPHNEIVSSSANMHMIPANDSIERELRALPKDALIRIEGLLVDARHTQRDWRWRTSMTRTDSGGGACELVYVQRLERLM